MTTAIGSDQPLAVPGLSSEAILDATIDALFIHDETGRIVHANQHACDLFGYKRTEFAHLTVEQLSEGEEPYSQRAAIAQVRHCLEQGSCEFTWRSRKKDGSVFWSRVTLRRQATSGESWVIAIVRDDERRKLAEDALRESEEKLSGIFQVSSNAMAFTEFASGRIVAVNKTWVSTTGIDRGQAIGKTALDLGLWCDPVDRETCRAELARTGRVHQHEARLAMHAGPQSTLISAETIALSSGTFALWEFRDLSELRQSENVARESDARLKGISQNFTDGMFFQVVAYPDGGRRFTYLSDAVRKLYGFTPEQGLADASLIYQRIHPEDIERVRRSEDAAAATMSTFQIEARLMDPSGEWRWSSIVSTPKPQPDGSIIWDGIEFIITNLKRAEQALAENERSLREAQHLAHLGSWSLDLTTNRLAWSEEVYRIFEIDPPLFGASYEAFLNAIHPEDREMVHQAFSQSVKKQEPYAIAHRLRLADGRIKHVQERGITTYDEQGRPLRSVGTVQDISREKQAEQARIELENQLSHSQRLESVGRLAGGVAHDFNNMLGVILGQVELSLFDLPPDHPVRTNLMEIQKAAGRSKDLTGQLLAFARKQTITPRVLCLNDRVAAMLKMIQRLIGEDIQLAWLPGAQLWNVKADASQMEQILANLCVNARDAIVGGGKITIETANCVLSAADCETRPGLDPGNYVLLRVIDTGCGMDRETQAHIFEPFFTTKEVGVGTGLGLSMVYGVVRQNNGCVEVHSEPGRGATFSVYLPRDSSAGLEADATKPHAARGGTETILLVEDEPSLLSLIATLLRKQGYTVLAARQPDEALRLAAAHAGDVRLLVSDVIMPGMSGRELANRVDEFIPNLARLFMSGYTADVIANHTVLDEGMNFIQKPFTMAEFAGKVRAILDTRAKP